ncbi:hypothetical protein Rhopal_003749-T1 [Rhodotorula paludigena]|uniref:PX domain-containing protein n=1 Tax=Rhodotorula paludigena TaxID=86838 RepID=A0AAV5GMJ3_9BASI|nr:hypothetical protein Rhopal_003749-T1 [Rhodotorula paludigena]
MLPYDRPHDQPASAHLSNGALHPHSGGPSRPLSHNSLSTRAGHPSRTNGTSRAGASRAAQGEQAAAATDYLYVDEQRRRGDAVYDSADSRASQVNGRPPPSAWHGGPAHAAEEDAEDDERAGPIDFRGFEAVDGRGTDEDEEQGRQNGNLSPEEAWYFLRELVGQEIRHEEGLLWKLRDLDMPEQGAGFDENLDPREAPILRYLIRHFLLTLPLVRDTVSDGDIPSLWTEGLHPVIRALHDADLSKAIDRGASGTAAHQYGAVRKALERFVAAGLKLSSSTYETQVPEPAAPPMVPQLSTSSQRYNFQPAAPSIERAAAAVHSASNPRPISASTSGSSSWSRRFSFNRLFGSTSGAPVTAAPGSPPRIPLPMPSSPFNPSEPSSLQDPADSQPDSRRTSAGAARPDSSLLPYAPSSAEPIAREDSETLVPPVPSSYPPASAPEEEADAMEELSLSRTATNMTSALDSQSFVTAAEAGTSRAGHSEAASLLDEEATTRFPGALPFPASAAGLPPVRVDEPPTPSSDYATPAASAGLAPPAPPFTRTNSSGPATDTEGFEYYPSDGALTPTQDKASSVDGQRSSAPETESPSTPKGKQRELGVEPYTVEESAPPSSKLPPPVPAVVPLPYQSVTPPEPTSARTSTDSVPAHLRQPARPRTPIQIPAAGARSALNEKRSKRFGIGKFVQNVRQRSFSGPSSSSASTAAPALPSPNETPASRRVPGASTTPTTSPKDARNGFVAHMALPAELFQPDMYAAPDEPFTDEGYEPRLALPPVLVPKGGVQWPFDASVPFLQGPDFEQLAWGGFEADIVGVRKSMFSHSYIIRVRRPARLDEFVLRTEAQFLKFYRNIDKAFPQAHIRRIPAGDPKNDTVIRPRPTLQTIASATSLHSGVGANGYNDTAPSIAPSRNQSRLLSGLRAAAADPHGAPSMSRTSSRGTIGSAFARSLRAQSVHTPGEAKIVRQRRSRPASLSVSHPARPQSAAGSYRSYPTSFGSRLAFPAEIGKKMPPHDPRRRALRAWLRDVLSVRTVGHHKETAAFLLLGSVIPRDSDVMDIAKREAIDDARRNVRSNDAQQSIEQVRTTRKHWSVVEKDIIHGEGLGEISEAIKTTRAIDGLPDKYQKVLESLRNDLAQTIYEMLVESESASSTFSKLKALHNTFPWFLVKQALRIKGSNLMTRALQDLLISRRFGGKSLLQKILSITLDDDPSLLAREMDRIQARIGSAVMVEKLNLFVHETREKKAIIRRYAEENNIELVLCIVRGADEPRLPGFELERVTAASKAYRKWAKTGPTPLAKVQVKDPDVRLVLDLQAYLRLASRDRDSTVFRQLLAHEEFASAIEVVAQPFVELLKRTYKVGRGAQALSDLQKFIDQLIIIIDALRSRVQDPQKSVRVISRLLQRHQQNLYSFVRSVHRGETIVEEFLQWAWTASVFLRRGLAQPIDLDELIPAERSEDRSYLFEELEDLVAFERAKRLDAFQAACRRQAGDVDADDPILVEGDGRGRSRVEPFIDPKPRKPALSEVPLYAAAFREQLKNVFSV